MTIKARRVDKSLQGVTDKELKEIEVDSSRFALDDYDEDSLPAGSNKRVLTQYANVTCKFHPLTEMNVSVRTCAHVVSAAIRSQSSPSTSIVLEWVKFNSSVADDDLDLLKERIAGLCTLLQSAGHPYFSALPHCEGFFEKSRTCFALVYQLPPFAVDNQPPLTLYSIFPRNMHSVADEKVSTSKSFLPSLEQRYDLAAAVADGVLSLLSVDWMHKTINSRNVALYNARPATGASSSLAGPGPTHGLDFRAPQLLGFGLSRPERLGERTVDLRDGGRSSWRFWLHPKLRYDGPHRQFERAFDVYALGVVLFEIGMWQDAYYYTSGGPRAAGLSADEFRRRLVHVCARDMAHHMGGAYKAAVMMCLDGDELWGSAKGLANSEKEGEASGDTVDVDGLSMAELFYLHVYSVLRGCCKVA